MKRMLFVTLQFALLLGISGIANSAAYEWYVATKVKLVQPTYMPNMVSFTLESAVSTACAAGTWMKWNPKGNTEAERIANANAVYSTLLTAFVSGKDVRVYGNDLDCEVIFLHMY